jgi:2'-5' RNA ligase
MTRPTALVVEVPEAQALYDAWADSWAAPPGVPAHVTLLLPFGSAEAHRGELRKLFAAAAPFSFRLERVERFPDGTAWLAPEPAEPFIALTEALVERFPAYPPYGGIHDEIVPHLTLAQGDPELLDRIVAPAEPIESHAAEALLLELGEDEVWRRRGTFRLGT